jgi:hypothetical protein
LKARAETEQTRLATVQEQERNRTELTRLIGVALGATQKADWPGATNAWGQAWRKADQLKEVDQREAAANEFEYAQAMEAGERLLKSGKAVEAAQEAAKALARNPQGVAAKDLKARAEAEQNRLATVQRQERDRAELTRMISAAQAATQKADGPAATNAWGQALRKADQMKETGQRGTASNELE